MIESVIGLYKTECVRHDGPFRRVDDFELATLSIPTAHGGSALPIGDLRQLYVYSLAGRVPQVVSRCVRTRRSLCRNDVLSDLVLG